MGQRLEFQSLLENVLGAGDVYFQPPGDLRMNYPCIVYNRSQIKTTFADNSPYFHTKRYQVTVIDRNPDSETPDKIAKLPMCSFDRHYVADNLNHDVFNIHF